jgi:hypothetical protein
MNASEFWSWFVNQRHRLVRLRDTPDEPLLDEITAELHRFCDQLWFEIGGHPEGPIEFIVSAEGDVRYFDRVTELVSNAPEIDGWQVVAFKPPQGFDFVTRFEGMEFDPADCWFLPLTSSKDPARIALRVGLPGFDPARSAVIESGLYIVVETGLGELLTSHRIAFLEACELPDEPEAEGFIRLNELGEYVVWAFRGAEA